MPTTGTEPDGRGWIVASELSKRFGRVRAVDALSFSVPPRSITGFLGPNGAGKTTTLRMLLGLITPDSGSATISGFSYFDLKNPVVQRRLGGQPGPGEAGNSPTLV